jgi:hypothetical protein
MRPPSDLSPKALELRQGLVSDLEARWNHPAAEVDLVLLDDVLRAVDRLADVGALIAAEGLTVKGSTGQQRPHPMLAVEVALRKEVAAGLKTLGLVPREDVRVVADSTGRLIRLERAPR